MAEGRRQGRLFEFRPGSVRFPDALAPWAFAARCSPAPPRAWPPRPRRGRAAAGRAGAAWGRRVGRRGLAEARAGPAAAETPEAGRTARCAPAAARARHPPGEALLGGPAAPARAPPGRTPSRTGPGRNAGDPARPQVSRRRAVGRGWRPAGGGRTAVPAPSARAGRRTRVPGAPAPHRRVPINHAATAMSSGRPAGAHRRILSRRPSRRARRPLIAPAGPGSARARRLTAHPSPQTRADGGPGGTAWPLITAPAASDGQGDGASRRQPALRPPRHPFPGACCPQETEAGQGLDGWTPFYSQRAWLQTPRGRARLGHSRKPAPRIPVAQPCLHLIEEGARGQRGPAHPSWK